MRADGADPVRWLRSGYCQPNGACVEVARVEGPGTPSAAIRDGTLPEAEPYLRLGPAAWRSLLTKLKSGEP
ncbi:DUF397 domain-containing protein [Actinomadura sp. 9N407]|uniref:DUF397 domain-containing protein n=1 Tax=Actinomadura sp. 9N407 TaxID=3375154 RepID=UPI0037B99C56